ncbi:AAA family ATPase [Streptomyces sp. NPDC091377]|uniref:AAA family ATPase n=1 Tax=Streptomyces sp. NPDC091377 TaxID=3365995 RepID=UPI0038142862
MFRIISASRLKELDNLASSFPLVRSECDDLRKRLEAAHREAENLNRDLEQNTARFGKELAAAVQETEDRVAAAARAGLDTTARLNPGSRHLPLDPGTLAVLIGIPGCGKSTFAAQYPPSWRVCLDEYRLAATDDMADQSATPVAAQIQNLLLDARLARARTIVADSTNVLPHVRAALLARARYWQRPAVAVLFDVPLATARAQNAVRERVVPRHVLHDLHARMPTPSRLHAEGFTTVHLVSDLTPVTGGTR